jgi:hypothetical protein
MLGLKLVNFISMPLNTIQIDISVQTIFTVRIGKACVAGWNGWCSKNRKWYRYVPKKVQSAIIPNLDKAEILFLHWTFTQWALSTHKIYCCNCLVVSQLCPGQSSKCTNAQMTITPKLGKAELWFFCTALQFNEIYLSAKCHNDRYLLLF